MRRGMKEEFSSILMKNFGFDHFMYMECASRTVRQQRFVIKSTLSPINVKFMQERRFVALHFISTMYRSRMDEWEKEEYSFHDCKQRVCSMND